MPVTPAHAVFAPLLDRWTGGRLPLSGVAVGCVAPDVEYFLHLRAISTWGHTPLGLVAWDLPLGLAMLVVFHGLLRSHLPLLLPAEARARLATVAPWRWGPPARFVGICAAIVIGAASHVALDSLTHENGWTVARVDALRADVLGLKVYTGLQYGLGILLVLILAAWTARWYRATSGSSPVSPGLARRTRTLTLAGLPLVVVPLALANGLRLVGGVWPQDPDGWRTLVAGAAFAAHTACAIYAVCASLVLAWRAPVSLSGASRDEGA